MPLKWPGKKTVNGWRQSIRNAWQRRVQARWRLLHWRRPGLARVVRWMLGITGVLLLLVLIVFLALLLSIPSVRQLQEVRTEIASDLYTADSLLLGRYYNQYRTVVSYEQIPEHVIQALVATEDERFFQHGGIDYRSWGRVLFRTILQGDESGGGGSTIQQQLAKNLFPRRDFWIFPLLVNKVREVLIAIRLDKAYSKEELLTFYLNTVSFPENVYGIERAARRFFEKYPSELDVEEGATLIGTLKANTYYNPRRYPERTRERRNVVLNQMAKNGYLSEATYDSLTTLPVVLNYHPGIPNQDIAPYFMAAVRQEMNELLAEKRKSDGTPYNLNTDGLKVYTTLHSGLQSLAEEAVAEHMSELQTLLDRHWRGRTAPWNDVTTIERAMQQSARYQQLQQEGLSEEAIRDVFEEPDSMNIFTWEGVQRVYMSPIDSIRHHIGLLQIGFMAMDPYTGFVRAWVGGNDFGYFQYDHVKARRQVGSVFKPIVYTQALRSGIDPCEQIPSRLLVYHEYAKGEWAIKDPSRDDPEPHFSPEGEDLDDWIPQNADGRYGGSYSLQGALTHSVNTATVDLIMQMGVDPVVNLAHRMGIESDIPPEPSIALGAAEVSLKEMVTVFGVLASRGRQVQPRLISRIETHDGELLVSFEEPSKDSVISREQADVMTHMLESVATMGTASRLRWKYGLYNLPIAGKTGTSQNHADGWFIGYTPKLVAGAWVGGDSPLVRFRNFRYGQGAATALPVWALFMKKVFDDPSLAAWQGGTFDPLSPEQRRELSCPMRIPSPEELRADSLQAVADSLRLLDTLPLLQRRALQLDSIQLD